jgi:GxxExxY protein
MPLLRSIGNLRELGPGLLESVYEACVGRELMLRKIPFRSQVMLPVNYKGLRLEAGLRLDLLVAESVIVELKAVRRMEPVFDAQPLTYLKLTSLRVGLLINFNVPLIKDGIFRVVL